MDNEENMVVYVIICIVLTQKRFVGKALHIHVDASEIKRLHSVIKNMFIHCDANFQVSSINGGVELF